MVIPFQLVSRIDAGDAFRFKTAPRSSIRLRALAIDGPLGLRATSALGNLEYANHVRKWFEVARTMTGV